LIKLLNVTLLLAIGLQIFVDDEICTGRDTKASMDRLREVFIRIRASSIRLKTRKMPLYATTNKFFP